MVFWGAPCVPSVNHAREKAAQLASSRTTVLAVRLGYEISDELILVGLVRLRGFQSESRTSTPDPRFDSTCKKKKTVQVYLHPEFISLLSV